MKKLSSYLTYLLLGFYFLYAISPLSFDVLGDQTGALSGNPGKTPKIIKLFAVDAILSAMLDDDEQDSNEVDAKDDAASSHNHIFLKKKRALRISVTQLIAQLSTRSAKWLGVTSRKEGIIQTALSPDACLSCPYGYRFLHSGVSPPLV